MNIDEIRISNQTASPSQESRKFALKYVLVR